MASDTAFSYLSITFPSFRPSPLNLFTFCLPSLPSLCAPFRLSLVFPLIVVSPSCPSVSSGTFITLANKQTVSSANEVKKIYEIQNILAINNDRCVNER